MRGIGQCSKCCARRGRDERIWTVLELRGGLSFMKRSGSEVLRHLRTQASESQKFEAKKTSLLEHPSKIYSAKSVQAPHTRCFEQTSHFTLRKSGQPSEDFDQVLGDNNGCWASYPKVYTHTQMDYAKGFDTRSTTGTEQGFARAQQ
ncbi:hypothetical protein GUJ93_ZPchr0011g28625 [Zizania palustris]|uniref:Uncharacterized protein n=1 Tax=Zizania palustris TaxID=103762 RepID=A0A8J5WG78_ZIZPA|nr:hypothetical protein GUJ93_ZPchr0011g28625 [Zizania palustris]